MARAYVVPAEPGWAPLRILLTRLERLGYQVEQWGRGDDWILLLS